MFEQTIANRLLKRLENIEYGSLTLITPDGKEHCFYGSDDLEASIQINDWRVLTNIAAKGSIGFTESYRDHQLDTPNLTNLCTFALKNSHILGNYLHGKGFSNILAQVYYYLRSNTLRGSKRNIHAHYDLGNDFYALWLDQTMTYSAGIFQNDTDSLADAQYNKYNRILERLDQPHGKLLEIGCGWGGFADQATSEYDLHIKGVTLSNEQHSFASKRLDKRADIVLEDYRKQHDTYDNIVSIEMFEAVGERFWPTYFSKVKSLLKSEGKAVIQTITIDEDHFARYRKTGDVIRSFIFPGGMLPSTSRFKHEVARADLRVNDCFSFGKDYAKTLQHWLDAFESNLANVRSLNFDEKFIRVWRLYLCGCIAGFSVGRTDVIQAELQHA